VRRSIARLVRSVGLRAETFPSAQAFLAQKLGHEPACLVLDVRLPGPERPRCPGRHGPESARDAIIFITGRGNVPMSVRAMKEGALDFLEKPFESEALLECIQRALAKSREGREVETERAAIERRLATLSPREPPGAGPRGERDAEQADRRSARARREKTIKIHRGRVMGKMDAASVAELVRMTYTVGFAPTLESTSLPMPLPYRSTRWTGRRP
jgi:FixJ family two-component response regulator